MKNKMRESAGGIIKGPDGRVVLVQQNGVSWSFPKGGVEEGETALQAATREIEEETCITDLALVRELGSYERYSISKDGLGENKEWGLQKKTLFLFTTSRSELPHRDPDSEITEVRFATLDEAYDLLTHPKDKEFLNTVRSILE